MTDGRQDHRTHRPHREELARRVLAVENIILQRAGTRREVTAFLSRAGKIVLLREGDADSITWHESELLSLHGSVWIIVHNHPRGTSLSPEDLALAMFLGAEEVRAVTPAVRFRLWPPVNSWPQAAAVASILGAEQAILVEEMSEPAAGRTNQRGRS